MIVYCTYSFILRADVFFTPVHDIQFLDSEGCFDLPTTGILDQFLIQYFSNVHPLLPMLTERDFWDAHAHPNPPHSKMLSLLLVQAMLFAACSVGFNTASQVLLSKFCGLVRAVKNNQSPRLQ